MPDEWKYKDNYKLLKINKNNNLITLYNTGKFYLNNIKGFTLKNKFNYAKYNFIGEYGGKSSWTESLFLYDLFDYPKNINITIDDLDKNYINLINYIIKNFYPQYFNNNNLDWFVINNLEIFYLLLKQRIDLKQSVSTFNNDLKLFSKIMKIAFNNQHELYKKYSQLQTDFNKIIIEKESGKNTLNKYEITKFINFEKLLEIRDKLEKEWRDNIEIDSNKVWELHYKMLLLSAYVLTPPTRKELMETKFIFNHKNIDKNIDYIYIPNKGYIQYIFNKIKKNKKSEKYVIGYSKESKIKLSNLFKESYKLYKREWVFPLLKNINKKSSIYNVNKIMENIIKNPKIGVNMIRSSYISWRSNNNINYNDMKDDAIKLRNSINTQMKDYRKINNNNNIKIELNNINIIDNNNKISHYKKQYYKKNKNYLLKKRQDYIKENKNKINAMYHINNFNKFNKIPKDYIIKKWKLYKDNNGNWLTQF